MIRVAVAGGFDPLHPGHLDHIHKAKQLGDYLIVILSRDFQMILKKGYWFMPFEDRFQIISALKDVDEVVKNIDHDTTCTLTLKQIRPDIFAKGGDRIPSKMPLSEIRVCKEMGCEIRYKIGDLLGSSQDYVDSLIKELKVKGKI